MDRLTPEQRRKNMQHVKNKDSQIELKLQRALWHAGFRYRKNVREVFGCPDIVFLKLKIAVFCDSEFWHGYDWENRKHDFKSNKEFWTAKIERNIARDKEVNEKLKAENRRQKGRIAMRYKMIDLFAGIGGIRLGFDKAFGYTAETVFVSEIDNYARIT